jgi:hypothetical protein
MTIRGEGETLEQVMERLWTEQEYENPDSKAVPPVKRNPRKTKPNPNTLDYFISK